MSGGEHAAGERHGEAARTVAGGLALRVLEQEHERRDEQRGGKPERQPAADEQQRVDEEHPRREREARPRRVVGVVGRGGIPADALRAPPRAQHQHAAQRGEQRADDAGPQARRRVQRRALLRHPVHLPRQHDDDAAERRPDDAAQRGRAAATTGGSRWTRGDSCNERPASAKAPARGVAAVTGAGCPACRARPSPCRCRRRPRVGLHRREHGLLRVGAGVRRELRAAARRVLLQRRGVGDLLGPDLLDRRDHFRRHALRDEDAEVVGGRLEAGQRLRQRLDRCRSRRARRACRR